MGVISKFFTTLRKKIPTKKMMVGPFLSKA
jgi:hypothetical protein